MACWLTGRHAAQAAAWVEAEEEGGRFRVAYEEGRYDHMEVTGAEVMAFAMGVYEWTGRRSNGRRVYKQAGEDG